MSHQMQTISIQLSQQLSIKLATTVGHFYMTLTMEMFIWLDYLVNNFPATWAATFRLRASVCRIFHRPRGQLFYNIYGILTHWRLAGAYAPAL